MLLVNIMILLFCSQTRDKEVAKFYIYVNNALDLHFKTRNFDIFNGLKIRNSSFVFNNIFSALYYFHKILNAIRKLQLSFEKSTLNVECKNAKEF